MLSSEGLRSGKAYVLDIEFAQPVTGVVCVYQAQCRGVDVEVDWRSLVVRGLGPSGDSRGIVEEKRQSSDERLERHDGDYRFSRTVGGAGAGTESDSAITRLVLPLGFYIDFVVVQ